MKTLITSQEASENAAMDLRFGRAKWFCIYDDQSKQTTFTENPSVDAQGGAGVKTAETAVEMGVTRIISGHFGPKAKEILDKFNIQLIENKNEQSIKEIITQLENNN
jgi:predicted Fe-Mo cluster-binding NifX family protein